MVILMLMVLVSISCLVLVTKTICRVMSTPSVEVEISTKEASMVMEPSIGQAVESVCSSPLLTQTDGQD